MKPELVERWFTTGFYPPVQRILTSLSNLFPVAALDLLVIGVGSWLIWHWWRALRYEKGSPRLRRAYAATMSTITAVAVVYLLFLVFWGLNYRRVPLSHRLVFETQAPTTSEAMVLAREAAAQLNRLHASAHAMGWEEPLWKSETFRQSADDLQRVLGHSSPALPGRLKRTIFGSVFRWNGVNGMVNPFGLEVLENPDLLPFERPFVLAHEWAHLAGYADEAEANFVGWLTCVRAHESAQYSGWLYLYSEILTQLPAQERKQVEGVLAMGPRRDREAIVARSQRGVLPVFQQASWSAYDRYLKVNRVETGIRSYGAVLTLILQAKFSSNWTPTLQKQM
tara:strand:+ start:550 stop:1563 length:1014 start_codon:yes stop_codon:yes gene_type:complete